MREAVRYVAPEPHPSTETCPGGSGTSCGSPGLTGGTRSLPGRFHLRRALRAPSPHTKHLPAGHRPPRSHSHPPRHLPGRSGRRHRVSRGRCPVLLTGSGRLLTPRPPPPSNRRRAPRHPRHPAHARADQRPRRSKVNGRRGGAFKPLTAAPGGASLRRARPRVRVPAAPETVQPERR